MSSVEISSGDSLGAGAAAAAGLALAATAAAGASRIETAKVNGPTCTRSRSLSWHASRQGLAVDQGAIAAAQVADDDRAAVDGEFGVLTTDLFADWPKVAGLATADLEIWPDQGNHFPLGLASHDDQLHFHGNRPDLCGSPTIRFSDDTNRVSNAWRSSFRQEGIGDEDDADQTPYDQHDPVGSASPPPTGTKPNPVAKSRCGPRRDLFPTIVFSLNKHGHYRTEVRRSRPRGAREVIPAERTFSL